MRLRACGLAVCPQGGADRPKIFELITRANVGDVDAWTAHWTDPKTTAKTTATVSDGLWVEGQKVRLCGLKAEALNGQEGTWQGTVNRWRNIAWFDDISFSRRWADKGHCHPKPLSGLVNSRQANWWPLMAGCLPPGRCRRARM